MIRMIVSDIDGTLIPLGGSVHPDTVDAIRRAVERGVLFVLASGRTYVNAAAAASGMGLDCPIISANGGRADAGTQESPIYEDRMDEALAARVCESLISEGCFMTSYVGTRVYTLPESNGYGSACSKVSEAKPGRAFALQLDRERMRREGVKGPYKFEAYSDDAELLARLRVRFDGWGLSVSSAFPYNLEILPPGGGKGKAVGCLAKKYGIAREEIMALGDGSNDIGMLCASGLPVAMGNAVDSLKAVASVVAPSCQENGAAWAIRKYALGEKV